WSVSAVPTESAGATSVTIDENCAESETTKNPQISTRGRSSARLPWNTKPTTSAQAPLSAIDRFTTNARPRRSASQPPQTDPSAPIAIAADANAFTRPGPSDDADDAARKKGIHVHIAYSSHMWPR